MPLDEFQSSLTCNSLSQLDKIAVRASYDHTRAFEKSPIHVNCGACFKRVSKKMDL